MKHLKKLSVVLMLTALFSVTFTSCIDNEVSPLVEAIYEAQADLIAAQAAVQNAEATKLEAEAAYQLALAAGANADAAYTLEQVEALRIANDLAQIAVDEAQAEFNVYLVELLAQLEEANAQIALDYALKYRLYANAATDLLDDKADAVYALAYAQAQADSTYPTYAIQALETVVANAQYQVEVNEAKIAELQALIDDPNSLPAQVTAWEAELAALEIAIDAKDAEIEAKYAERDNLIAGWDGEDDVRDNFVQQYEGYVADSLSLSNQIEVYQDDIDDWTAALATYDADLAAADAAVTAADDAVTAAWLALGEEDAAGNTPAFGAYFTIDADEIAIGAGGAKYAPATNLQQAYVNARIDYLDALDELNTYQADFDLLTVSYNAAAVALEAAQAAFDGNTYVADLATAEANLTTEEGEYDDAETAYTAARIAFEADPTGSVNADGVDLHALAQISYGTMDLGEVGIHTDLAGDTYMRVDTWKETSIGSGEYVPASFYPTKYNAADLAVHITAIKADVAAPNTNITVDGDIWVWEATGAGAMEINDGGGVLVNVDDHALTAGEASLADTDNLAVFVNVELDDTSVPNLYTFNVATNMLGTDDFSDRAIIGNPAAIGYMAPLTTADVSARYDTTPDTEGEDNGGAYALTAEAELWNAQLEVAYRTYMLEQGDDALVAAQAEFDYQQELFDNGAANLAGLAADLDAADTAQDLAQDNVDAAWVELGDAVPGAPGDSGDTPVVDPETLNEILFNAEIAFDILNDCDADCLQTSIDAAQHQIDLLQPSLDFALARIAEMQAQYDIYMETYIPGSSTNYANLDADLKVLYDTLSFEIFELNQELNDLDADYDAIDDILNSLGNDDNLSDISLDIELAILYDNSQGSYLDSLNDLEDAEEALAEALADNADDATYLAYLQSKVDVLEQRYQNALALAAKYKALMEAALAS